MLDSLKGPPPKVWVISPLFFGCFFRDHLNIPEGTSYALLDATGSPQEAGRIPLTPALAYTGEQIHPPAFHPPQSVGTETRLQLQEHC